MSTCRLFLVCALLSACGGGGDPLPGTWLWTFNSSPGKPAATYSYTLTFTTPSTVAKTDVVTHTGTDTSTDSLAGCKVSTTENGTYSRPTSGTIAVSYASGTDTYSGCVDSSKNETSATSATNLSTDGADETGAFSVAGNMLTLPEGTYTRQ
jgi:hypothetical protein